MLFILPYAVGITHVCTLSPGSLGLVGEEAQRIEFAEVCESFSGLSRQLDEGDLSVGVGAAALSPRDL